MYSTGTETFPAFFEWWKIIELLNDTPSFERYAATELFWIQYVQQVTCERSGCERIAYLSMFILSPYTLYSILRHLKDAATGIQIPSSNELSGIFWMMEDHWTFR